MVSPITVTIHSIGILTIKNLDQTVVGIRNDYVQVIWPPLKKVISNSASNHIGLGSRRFDHVQRAIHEGIDTAKPPQDLPPHFVFCAIEPIVR
jgi:hypothetical protein